MLTKCAADLGADGILSISPYYNKPTQEGIYQHFKAIAESVDIPIVLYNVPGRTGSNMLPETTLRLAEIDNIKAIKEASGNMSQIQQILARRPEGFTVLSGDDGLTLALMSMGADGVISVASNCCPGLMSELVSSAASGDFEVARAMHNKLLPLFGALFCESNPIPIKYVMGNMGYGNGVPRLPLTPLSPRGRGGG